MENSIPRPKKRCALKVPSPLPLIWTKNNVIYKFEGIFDGFSVQIRDSNDMKKIVSMGYFGKANLSRSYPQFEESLEKPQIIRKRQYKRRLKWHLKFKSTSIEKIIVIPDSDDENEYFHNLQAIYELDKCGNKEFVSLTLEEAFFLQNGLGCLDIFHENKLLANNEIWDLFTESDSSFRLKYVVYYHFRSKNWVVKPGIKFGGDFLLYKEGPPFYHASFVVLIQNMYEGTNNIDTTAFMGLHRMCETAGKELLICQIFNLKEVLLPEHISKVIIKEILVKRWISSQER